MLKRYLCTVCFIFLVGFILLCCTGEKGESDVVGSSDHADLVGLFKEFREFDKPKSLISRGFDRPKFTNGVPDYAAAAMEKQYRELKTFQSRLAAIDPSGWSVSEQIDYHLVRAEMNGLEFRHRVLRPWSRDPSFYQNLIPGLGRTQELPLQGEALTGFRTRLQAIPEIIKQAKMNLKNLSEVAGDLALFAIHDLEGSTSFQNLATQLADHHPNLVPDVKEAQAAIDDYLGWLKKNQSKMTASAGVGKENYNWLLKNVYLFPYTWDECLDIVKREDNRVITFLKLEENRNRNLPPLEVATTKEEFYRQWSQALYYMMDFCRKEEILTVPDYLNPKDYGRLAPPRPWPRPPVIFQKCRERDPLPIETHEFIGHHFDLVRVRHDDRPIRGNREHEGPYAVAATRCEGFAFALEELLMHTGYLDSRQQRARELVYLQTGWRSCRAIADLKMHSNEITLKEAMRFCVDCAPRGWALEDGPHVWGEMQTTLRRNVGWHMGMVVGKAHFIKLFRDRAKQLGDKFNLKEFMDEFLAAGMIPMALTRWEMTGLTDEIKKLW